MNTDPLERDNAVLLGVLLEVPGLLTGDALARASGWARWPQQRRTVLDLLDVRVTVTGWKCCEACGGRGKIKGGKGGLRCRAFHGHAAGPHAADRGRRVGRPRYG